MRRSQSRVLRISKLQIEKKMEKLKRRMNRLYVEYLSHEQALKLFEKPTQEEAQQVVSKEQELRKEIVQEIEKLQDVSQPVNVEEAH